LSELTEEAGTSEIGSAPTRKMTPLMLMTIQP
jgi:hypothetical protein